MHINQERACYTVKWTVKGFWTGWSPETELQTNMMDLLKGFRILIQSSYFSPMYIYKQNIQIGKISTCIHSQQIIVNNFHVSLHSPQLSFDKSTENTILACSTLRHLLIIVSLHCSHLIIRHKCAHSGKHSVTWTRSSHAVLSGGRNKVRLIKIRFSSSKLELWNWSMQQLPHAQLHFLLQDKFNLE